MKRKSLWILEHPLSWTCLRSCTLLGVTVSAVTDERAHCGVAWTHWHSNVKSVFHWREIRRFSKEEDSLSFWRKGCHGQTRPRAAYTAMHLMSPAAGGSDTSRTAPSQAFSPTSSGLGSLRGSLSKPPDSWPRIGIFRCDDTVMNASRTLYFPEMHWLTPSFPSLFSALYLATALYWCFY